MPFGAVRRYPCRLVSIDYSTSMHFHGGNTGSNPVGDAIFPMSCGQDLCVTHTDMFMKHKPMAQSAVKDFPDCVLWFPNPTHKLAHRERSSG